jgi:hypothetical protein
MAPSFSVPANIEGHQPHLSVKFKADPSRRLVEDLDRVQAVDSGFFCCYGALDYGNQYSCKEYIYLNLKISINQ